MISVTFARYTQYVTRRDTNALLLSLDRSARSSADACLRAGSLSAIFSAIISVTRISNVIHGSLNPVATSSCVRHTSSLVTFFSSACISDNWMCNPTSRGQHGGCTLFLGQTLVEPVFLQLVRHLEEASNISKRLSTPSFCQWSALYSTHFKNLVVDSNTMMGCPQRRPSHTSFIQYHVRVIRTVLTPQDPLSKLQTFFMHMFAKQPLVACSAIRTLRVLGHDVRHSPPALSSRNVDWECCPSACAPKPANVPGAYP